MNAFVLINLCSLGFIGCYIVIGKVLYSLDALFFNIGGEQALQLGWGNLFLGVEVAGFHIGENRVSELTAFRSVLNGIQIAHADQHFPAEN